MAEQRASEPRPPATPAQLIEREREKTEDPDNPSREQLLKMSAEDREKLQARTRGVSEDDLAALAQKTKWYLSNRGDDRVVLWERDNRHPGGEVLIGGSSPVRAYQTERVLGAVYNLLLIDVPEPMRTVKGADGEEIANRKYPPDPAVDMAIVTAAQPGQPVPLGRKLDPELWDEGARSTVAQKQAEMPTSIPVPPGAIVGGPI